MPYALSEFLWEPHLWCDWKYYSGAKKKKMICSYNPNTLAFPVAMGSGSLDIQWDIVVVSIGMALIDKWIWVLAPQEVALLDSVALLKELCHCEHRF